MKQQYDSAPSNSCLTLNKVLKSKVGIKIISLSFLTQIFSFPVFLLGFTKLSENTRQTFTAPLGFMTLTINILKALTGQTIHIKNQQVQLGSSVQGNGSKKVYS